MQACILALCMIMITPLSAFSPQPIQYAILSGFTPGSTYDIGDLRSADIIKVTLTWQDGNTYTTKLYKIVDGIVTQVSLQDSEITVFDNNESLTKVLNQNATYLLVVQTTARLGTYNIKISINGVEVADQIGYALTNYHVPVKKLTINNSCKIKLKFIGPPSTLGIFDNQSGTDLLRTDLNEFTYKFEKSGEYFIYILPADYVQFVDIRELVPFTIILYTFCDYYCTNPAILDDAPLQHCLKCGNGILEEGEECDNGNQLGCVNCYMGVGYYCSGPLGGSSTCIKFPVCGDGVLDDEQQCDNGNKLGCSDDCLIDAGYRCSQNLGVASVCQLCGNGIVEGTEQCDNKNGVGCSQNCKIDVGFECRQEEEGRPSVCSATIDDPHCGNGIFQPQYGEICDDNNLVNEDGCNKFCQAEVGWICLDNTKCLNFFK